MYLKMLLIVYKFYYFITIIIIIIINFLMEHNKSSLKIEQLIFFLNLVHWFAWYTFIYTEKNSILVKFFRWIYIYCRQCIHIYLISAFLYILFKKYTQEEYN